MIRYVGQTSKGLKRPRAHNSPARKRNAAIQRWVRGLKTRGMTFGILVLDWFPTAEPLDAAEQGWISRLREYGYKLCNSTDGGCGLRGMKFSEEHKRRIGEANSRLLKGKRLSAEHIAKIAASNRGRKPTPATIEKMRLAQCGRVITESHRQKLSESHRGHRPSPASLAKRSASMKGKIRTAEHRMRLAVALSGHAVSAETRARISEKLKGRKIPPEVLAKRRKPNSCESQSSVVDLHFSYSVASPAMA